MPLEQEPPTSGARLIASWLVTWFRVGYLPKAPGTFGSIAALPFAWALVWLGGPWLLLVAAAVTFVVGCWAVQVQMAEGDDHDPGFIVIDEVAGQWLTLLAAPLTPLAYVLGLIAFRCFDILKPWPIGWLDRHFQNAFGVMIDDVAAAIYAGVLLYGVVWLVCL
ncbi:MAG: phosphatidylglycerophosphatase A family protein [Geminicoccaceae bacterium]